MKNISCSFLQFPNSSSAFDVPVPGGAPAQAGPPPGQTGSTSTIPASD